MINATSANAPNRNYVWNVGTLSWVVMTQPTGGGGGGGAVTVADGADVAEGSTTDVAVQGNNPGTVSAKLRGLNTSITLLTDATELPFEVSTRAMTIQTPDGNTSPIPVLDDHSDVLVALTGGTQVTKLTDGTTGPVTVRTGGSAVAPASDKALVVVQRDTLALPTGAATSSLQTTGNNNLQNIVLSTASVDTTLLAASATPGSSDTLALIVQGAVGGVAVDVTSSGVQVATAAIQTSGTQRTQITDGVRNGTVKAASTPPLVTDTAVVVTQRDALPAGTNVIGSVSLEAETTVNALVSDARRSYVDGEIQPLSLTSDGRLRVSVSQADINLDFFLDSSPYGTVGLSGAPVDNPWAVPSPW